MVANPEVDSCTVKHLTDGDTYTFTVTPTNANGAGAVSAASAGVTPTTLVPVAITSADSTATGVNQLFRFKVTAVGNPATTLKVSGQPSWVKKSSSVAGKPLTLSGTPGAGAAGNHSFTIEASNGVSAPVYQTFTISVLRITSGTTAQATAKTPFSFEITTSDTPANPTITVTGLPAGLTAGNYSNGDEYITGSPKPGEIDDLDVHSDDHGQLRAGDGDTEIGDHASFVIPGAPKFMSRGGRRGDPPDSVLYDKPIEARFMNKAMSGSKVFRSV